MVVGLDAKMNIVYGWYRAENEESSDKSKWKKKTERKRGKLQARTPACRVMIRIIQERLCPLGHGGVLAKSMTFITFVDVLHALIQNLCNFEPKCGFIISKYAKSLHIRRSPA